MLKGHLDHRDLPPIVAFGIEIHPFFPPALSWLRKKALTVIGFKVFINLSQSEYPCFFLFKKCICLPKNLWKSWQLERIRKKEELLEESHFDLVFNCFCFYRLVPNSLMFPGSKFLVEAVCPMGIESPLGGFISGDNSFCESNNCLAVWVKIRYVFFAAA